MLKMKKKRQHAKIKRKKIAVNEISSKKKKLSRRSVIELGIVAFIALFAISLYLSIISEIKIQFSPDEEYRIFVTNDAFVGGFESIFGADAICTNLANQAGLPGNNWRAWLSNEFISISEHLYHSELPYVMYDKDGNRFVVANNWDDLTDGTLQSPINLNEFGETLGSERVWTGTKTNGGLSNANCKNWQGTAKVFFGITGLTSATDLKWTENSDIDQCIFPRHIYCIQQPEIIQQRIRVFVTSDRYDGKQNGLAGLDAICENYAKKSNINRQDTIGWKAWASDTTTAMKDRYPNYELPFVRLADDIKIADGWGDLTDGSLDAPINRDERGAWITEKVWTHTNLDGSSKGTSGSNTACNDWTSNNFKAGRGNTIETNHAWTSYDEKSCEDKSRIYCFEIIRVNNEVCDDGLDNDGDGKTDCSDDFCEGKFGGDGAMCEPNGETTCDDGLDNDGDGNKDCGDEDCDGLTGQGGEICEYSGETMCDDGEDNDGDGKTDCEDRDCNGISGCEYGSELSCGDGKDNDGNGLIDCLDNSCNGKEGCEFTTEKTCYDGKDNDGDGRVDCSDSDCLEDTACVGFIIFVSSDRYSPTDIRSIENADGLCQNLADNEELGGTYKAWLSTQTISIRDNLCHSTIKYRKVNNDGIANNWDDLTDGTLQSPINIDQKGNTPSGGLDVWTHTNLDGSSKGTSGSNTACNDWTTTDTNIRATIGDFNVIDSSWTDAGTSRCSGRARLYCVQQPSSEKERAALCSNSGGSE